MAVDVRQSEQNAVVKVVFLSGRLDLEKTEADAPAVLQALDESDGGIIVDLGAVDFLSSAGLRLLLQAKNRAQEGGKRIALVRTQPIVYKIFKVSGLHDAFRFFESEADAVTAVWQ